MSHSVIQEVAEAKYRETYLKKWMMKNKTL